MVKMMVLVIYFMTAEGLVYGTMKTSPIPETSCLEAVAAGAVSAARPGADLMKFECLPSEVSQ